MRVCCRSLCRAQGYESGMMTIRASRCAGLCLARAPRTATVDLGNAPRSTGSSMLLQSETPAHTHTLVARPHRSACGAYAQVLDSAPPCACRHVGSRSRLQGPKHLIASEHMSIPLPPTPQISHSPHAQHRSIAVNAAELAACRLVALQER